MKIKAGQIQILGILALALLFILTIPLFASRIPSVLQTYLSQDLSEQGYDWVSVDVKGRNITLSGNVSTNEKSLAALNVMEKYTPILRINDQITLRIIEPYSITLDWDGKELILNGYVPNKENHQNLIEIAYQKVDKENIKANLDLGAGAPENWQKLVMSSLKNLLKLQRGHIDITNQSLYFVGQTPRSTERDEIIEEFDGYSQYQKKLHIVATDDNKKVCHEKFEKLLINNIDIKFMRGKAILDKSSYPFLTKLANIGVLCSHLKISVEGYTDNMGNFDANIKLSKKRAQSVVSWLFRKGVAEQQLSAIGHGASNPLANNNTEAGREKNRRIEFVIKGD